MDNITELPDGHPLKNVGVEAALLRLGNAIADYAEDAKVEGVTRTDGQLMCAALNHVALVSLAPVKPTTAVVLIDEMREQVEGLLV